MNDKVIFDPSEQDQKNFGLIFGSDSLLLDTLDMVHREVYLPAFIETFGLEQIQGLAAETWLFIALESRNRGSHPLKILLATCRELRERPGLKSLQGILESLLPPPAPLEALINRLISKSGRTVDSLLDALCNRESFNHLLQDTQDQEEQDLITDLELLVLWRENCRSRGQIMLAPQTMSREASVFLQRLKSDTWFKPRIISACVHTLSNFVLEAAPAYTQHFDQLIAPSLDGKVCLENAQVSQLMIIGDSPQDALLAEELGACFFPMLPGRFRECWLRLETEAWPRFLAGNYTATYQTRLNNEFHACFPLLSPWEMEALKRVS